MTTHRVMESCHFWVGSNSVAVLLAVNSHAGTDSTNLIIASCYKATYNTNLISASCYVAAYNTKLLIVSCYGAHMYVQVRLKAQSLSIFTVFTLLKHWYRNTERLV